MKKKTTLLIIILCTLLNASHVRSCERQIVQPYWIEISTTTFYSFCIFALYASTHIHLQALIDERKTKKKNKMKTHRYGMFFHLIIWFRHSKAFHLHNWYWQSNNWPNIQQTNKQAKKKWTKKKHTKYNIKW